MTGAQCLADMLKGFRRTHVFHVPAVLRTTYAEMERRTDIKRLHVHGEKAAAYMADGYARASGKPGVCAARVIGAPPVRAGGGGVRARARPGRRPAHDSRSRGKGGQNRPRRSRDGTVVRTAIRP